MSDKNSPWLEGLARDDGDSPWLDGLSRFDSFSSDDTLRGEIEQSDWFKSLTPQSRRNAMMNWSRTKDYYLRAVKPKQEAGIGSSEEVGDFIENRGIREKIAEFPGVKQALGVVQGAAGEVLRTAGQFSGVVSALAQTPTTSGLANPALAADSKLVAKVLLEKSAAMMGEDAPGSNIAWDVSVGLGAATTGLPKYMAAGTLGFAGMPLLTALEEAVDQHVNDEIDPVGVLTAAAKGATMDLIMRGVNKYFPKAKLSNSVAKKLVNYGLKKVATGIGFAGSGLAEGLVDSAVSGDFKLKTPVELATSFWTGVFLPHFGPKEAERKAKETVAVTEAEAKREQAGAPASRPTERSALVNDKPSNLDNDTFQEAFGGGDKLVPIRTELAKRAVEEKGLGSVTGEDFSLNGQGRAMVDGLSSRSPAEAINKVSSFIRDKLLDESVPIEKRGGITESEISWLRGRLGMSDGPWTKDGVEEFNRRLWRYVLDGRASEKEFGEIFWKVSEWLRDTVDQVSASGNEVGQNRWFEDLFKRVDRYRDAVRAESEPVYKQLASKLAGEDGAVVKPEDFDKPTVNPQVAEYLNKAKAMDDDVKPDIPLPFTVKEGDAEMSIRNSNIDPRQAYGVALDMIDGVYKRLGVAIEDPNKLKRSAGWSPITHLQEKTAGAMHDALTRGIRDVIERGRHSKYGTVRLVTDAIQKWMGFFGQTEDRQEAQRQLTGAREMAAMQPQDIFNLLVRNFSPEERLNVHRALDPEVHTDPTGQKFEPVTLSPKEQQLAEILGTINDITHHLTYAMGGINKETFKKNYGKYIMRGYDQYEIPTPSAAEAPASIIKNAVVNTFVKGRKEWENISKAMREQVIKDPVYLTMKRFQQVLVSKAAFDFMDDIMTNSPRLVSESERPGFVYVNNKKKNGPWAGKWVAKEAHEDMVGYYSTHQAVQTVYDMLRAYENIGFRFEAGGKVREFRPRRLLKIGVTVLNPVVQLGNILVNIAFAAWGGVGPVQYLANSIKGISDVKNRNGIFRWAVANGLIGSNIGANDKYIDFRKLAEMAESAAQGKDPMAMNLKALMKKPTVVYQTADDVAKLAMFRSYLEKGFDKNKAKDLTLKAMQDYRQVGAAWDIFSKIPVVGQPFAKFSGDLMRLIYNAIGRRPLSTAASLAAYKLGMDFIGSQSGETEDEKKLRESRGFMPSIYVPGFGKISLTTRIGNTEVNLARYMSPFYGFSPSGAYESNEDASAESYAKFVPAPLQALAPFLPREIAGVPFFGNMAEMDQPVPNQVAKGFVDVLLGPLFQVLIDHDFRGMPISDPKSNSYDKYGSMLSWLQKDFNRAVFLIRSYTPQPIKDAIDMTSVLASGIDSYGREKTPSQAFARFAGIRAVRFGDKDYDKAAESLSNRYTREFESVMKKYSAINNEYLKGKISADRFRQLAMSVAFRLKKLREQASLVGDLLDRRGYPIRVPPEIPEEE